jgi:hypothetical protein
MAKLDPRKPDPSGDRRWMRSGVQVTAELSPTKHLERSIGKQSVATRRWGHGQRKTPPPV